jgi:hypothetical protein
MRLGEGGETILLHVVLPSFKNGWSYTSTPTYTFMVKIKVKVVPVHAMKLVWLQAFLTLSLDGDERSD